MALFVNSGFRVDPNRPVFAIRPGGTGDISLQKGETSDKFIACLRKATHQRRVGRFHGFALGVQR